MYWDTSLDERLAWKTGKQLNLKTSFEIINFIASVTCQDKEKPTWTIFNKWCENLTRGPGQLFTVTVIHERSCFIKTAFLLVLTANKAHIVCTACWNIKAILQLILSVIAWYYSWGLVESILSGCFWHFASKFWEEGRDLQLIFYQSVSAVWGGQCTNRWWGHKNFKFIWKFYIAFVLSCTLMMSHIVMLLCPASHIVKLSLSNILIFPIPWNNMKFSQSGKLDLAMASRHFWISMHLKCQIDRHPKNAWYNKAYSVIGRQYLAIIASDGIKGDIAFAFVESERRFKMDFMRMLIGAAGNGFCVTSSFKCRFCEERFTDIGRWWWSGGFSPFKSNPPVNATDR